MLIVLFKKCVDKIRIKKASSKDIELHELAIFLATLICIIVGVTRLLGEEKKASDIDSSTKLDDFQQSSTEINNYQR